MKMKKNVVKHKYTNYTFLTVIQTIVDFKCTQLI